MEVIIEVSRTHEATQYLPVDASESAFSESWLQETLRRYPEVLPVDEFGPAFHPLVPIGREVPTDAGSIDNLFISHGGYLVIAETKLWRNPEARREVVAQLIDYATAMTRLTYAQLDELTQDYLRKHEGKESMSLEEWVEARVEPVDVGFQGRVSRNLKLGRFLLLIVTDQERPQVVDMLRRLSAQAWLSIDLAVVVLRPFRRAGDRSGGLLLVPQIEGRTEVIERSAIEVTVVGAPDARVSVRKDRPEDRVGSRTTLTSEIAFWELMRDRAPDAAEPARRLIDMLRSEGFELRLAESSIVVDGVVPGSDVTVPMFFIKANGKLVFWPRTFARRARNAGIRDDVASRYVTRMLAVLSASSDSTAYRYVQDLDPAAIQGIALEFRRQVAGREG
jgi:hypothetical protein